MAMKGRGVVLPVYEDFKPNSEWQQDAHSHTLVIFLPGFIKEQLRVSTESQNIIRVRGERPIAGNKWNRFLEDFELPENSDMYSIRARFNEGTLTITIPKKTVDTPDEFAPEMEDEEPHQDEKREQADDWSKETNSSEQKHSGLERAEAELAKMMAKEERKSEISKELLGEDETGKKIKPKTKRDDGAAEKGKGKEVIESSRAELGTLTKAVKGVAELKEERQLMVNMGVAALVIVAFTAYVSYKFICGDEKK